MVFYIIFLQTDFPIPYGIGGNHMNIPFKDLNLNNSYLFAATLSDPETCRLVLEIIIGHKLPRVKVTTEKTILLSSEAKWIRLDVSATDELNVHYNLESQNADDENIAKRSRYYQAEMDVSLLKPGDAYEKLPESYVIFICTFDPFGKGLYRYTFTEKCQENGMCLGDGTYKIFLNTKGTNPDEISNELKHFLKYYTDTTDKCVEGVDDKLIRELHEKVTSLKKSREWEAGYMKMSEILENSKREGIVEGRNEGIKEGHHNSLLLVLETKGSVPDDLRERIDTEQDIEVLDKWIRLAATSESVENFQENM